MKEAFLNANPYDVVCFSEHFLRKAEVDSLSINGYNVGSFYARSVLWHGGVLILCKHNLSFIEKTDVSSLLVERVCELAAVELTEFHTVIVTIYRSPISDFKEFLSVFNTVLIYLSKNSNNRKVIITGDFNVKFFSGERDWFGLKDLLTSFDFIPTVRGF